MRLLALLLWVLLVPLSGCPDPIDDDDVIGDDDDVIGDDDDVTGDDDDSGADDDDATGDDDDDDATTPDPCPEPAPPCEGICALYEPTCTATGWDCSAPGMQTVETTCDGFDNDCDGEVDEEGVCPDCSFDLTRIGASLGSIWDIDFDFDCNTYLTTLVSGPDWTVKVPADANEPTSTWYGNANQNMGYALVDPDPANRRVVVTYSCCVGCGCQAQNGLTLLYTCERTEPGCGCAAETNCPGFLDAPFLPAGYDDGAAITFNGINVVTPSGLAVGPRSTYFVGNYRPPTCSEDAACTPCDPAHPGVFCTVGQANCCDGSPQGRLVQFTLPVGANPASWRVAAIYAGEVILGLASGRDGSVMVGTDLGNLYRFDPVTETSALVQTFGGAVFSITQHRTQGDWYVELRADPKLVRLDEAGTTLLALPGSVPANPDNDGVIQWAPDGNLWRLQGQANTTSPLDVFVLP